MNPRIKLLFTLSLILNVVFIGVGLGLLYRFCMDMPMRIPGDMSPEARHFIAKTFQDGRDQTKPLIEDIKSQRTKVENIITAKEFDLKAYNAAVDDMLETRDEISRTRAKIMGEALKELPAEDRKRFAKRILDGLEGKRKKGYHHKYMKENSDKTSHSKSD
jgi:uncharacterized membrane protein